MESIKFQERFFPCSYCENLVSSELPTCEECGLEMSSTGIDELARTEESNDLAIEEANLLTGYAMMFFIYSIIAGFLFNPESGYIALMLIECWLFGFIGVTYLIIRWHQRYRQIYSELDILEKVLKVKNTAIRTYLCSICLTIFWLWIKL